MCTHMLVFAYAHVCVHVCVGRGGGGGGGKGVLSHAYVQRQEGSGGREKKTDPMKLQHKTTDRQKALLHNMCHLFIY